MCVCRCAFVCASVIVYTRSCGRTTTHSICVCICIFVFKKEEKKNSAIVCVFSPLHALTHLTQQQMAVCHQSVDSSRIFPWKESLRRETRVQMAVYSATSHPQGVMKEGLSYCRTPSQCSQWSGYVQSCNTKSC